jgi:hypothetical protein
MDIESLSTNMTQDQVREEAAVRVESMALQTIREQSAALEKLMESAEAITDPSRGNYLDFYA